MKHFPGVPLHTFLEKVQDHVGVGFLLLIVSVVNSLCCVLRAGRDVLVLLISPSLNSNYSYSTRNLLSMTSMFRMGHSTSGHGSKDIGTTGRGEDTAQPNKKAKRDQTTTGSCVCVCVVKIILDSLCSHAK